MHVSFRNRLTFFFIVLVILPVLAVAAVGILLVRDSESTKNDELAEPRAGSRRRACTTTPRDRAMAVARTVQTDDRLAEAVRDGDRAAQQDRLEALTERTGAVRVRLVLDGQEPVEAGEGEAIAPVRSRVVDANGEPAGELDLSVTRPDDFATLLERVTGFDVVLSQGGKSVAGNLEGAPGDLPLDGDVEINGEEYRATGFETEDFDPGNPLGIHVLTPDSELQDSVSENTLGIFLILIAFLASALAFALTAARSLGRQTAQLVDAAKQVGAGDFSVHVPTEGNDEFAQLGEEFNAMAAQLQAREAELEHARVQRVGQSVGGGIDRTTQLTVVVRTAVENTQARGGRVVMNHGVNGTLEEAARAGDVTGAMGAIAEVEEAVLRAGEPSERSVARRQRARPPAHAARGRRARRADDRARRRAVLRQGPRDVQLPGRLGGAVARERRAARDDPAPGRHGRADRPLQPPPLPGVPERRGRALPPLRRAARADDARHRRLQARQRQLRASPGRRGPARGGARAEGVLARGRRARPLRRRGDGRRAPADRAAGRVRVRRARARPDRGSCASTCWRATGRSASRRRSASPRCRIPRPRRRTRSSPPPTPPSTARSAPARTAL